jgi:hypothetical protein
VSSAPDMLAGGIVRTPCKAGDLDGTANRAIVTMAGFKYAS